MHKCSVAPRPPFVFISSVSHDWLSHRRGRGRVYAAVNKAKDIGPDQPKSIKPPIFDEKRAVPLVLHAHVLVLAFASTKSFLFSMKSKLEKPYAERHNLRYIPSNFRTAKPTERLSVPAVAIAVFSESVRCFIVDQLKVYMSAMFENRRSKNSTPSRRTHGYIPSSNFRTATPRERLSTPAVAVAVSSESVPCFTVDQFKVYMSAMFENRRSKNSTPSVAIYAYIPSNFRTATPTERLSTPAVAIAVFSESVSVLYS